MKRVLVLALSGFLTACGNLPPGLMSVGGDLSKPIKVVVPPQTIPGAGVFGAILDLTGFNVPFTSAQAGSAAMLQGTRSVRLERFALRTVVNADEAQDVRALINSTLVEKCRPGQSAISWLHSIRMFVAVKGRPETRVVLAEYSMPESQRNQGGVCGFFLKTNPQVNLVDFLPEYETSLEVEGSAPQNDVTISGFVSVQFDGSFQYAPFDAPRSAEPSAPASTPPTAQPSSTSPSATPTPKPTSTRSPGVPVLF